VLKDHTRNGKGQYIHRGFNTVRHPKTSFASNPGHIWFVLRSDWFHLVVEMRSAKILLFLMVLYVTCILFYALMWLSIGLQKDDPCETGIDNLTDAYYFSAITFTTIGYGANTVFFGSCASVPTLITIESFTGLLIHSLAMGIIFAKTQRGNTRGYSIAYSKKCLVRIIRGQPHLLFRVCEARKLQLIEAHVRLYAILDEKDPLTGEVGVASHQLRLNQPDDEMGGMLLLLLPSKVVHRIDSWSPLLPTAMQPSKGSPMQSYTFPDVRLRSADVEQGNRTGVECMVTGEGFGTEEAHRLHHEREGFAYPCKGSPIHENNNGDTALAAAAFSDAQQAELVRRHFEDTNIEIMVLVEGIDPTCSTTLASCYSYKIGDILFESHDFVECTSRDKSTGQVHIDFFKFHEVKPLPSTHHASGNSSSCAVDVQQQQQQVNNDGASGSRRLSPSQPPEQPLLVGSGEASSEGSSGGSSGSSSPARKMGVAKLGLAGMMMCMLSSGAHGTAMKNQLLPVRILFHVLIFLFLDLSVFTFSHDMTRV
jgi:potassium inwardly-rectifying channel subfamily J